MYLCISLYCDACLKSSALRVEVKTLHNTISYTINGTNIPYTRNQLTLEPRLIVNSPSDNTWKASVAKSDPVIASYIYWLAQHGVPTPLFCEI